MLLGKTYSQNSGNVYSTQSARQGSVSDWTNNQERNDFRYREEQRNVARTNNNRNNGTNQNTSYVRTLQRFYLFGGEDYKTFIGCINCDKFDKLSVWNKYDKFGSALENESIWNKYSDFGGSNGKYSPFNIYAEKPPMIIDEDGKLYGYFTADKFKEQRATWYITDLLLRHYEVITNDIEYGYKVIFEQ